MKVLLVDDHAVVRQGYASVLSVMLDDCEVLEASHDRQAIEKLAELPDLAVVDINLAGSSGVELASQMLKLHPKLPILFFSMYDETGTVRQALSAGGRGYITKSSPPNVLVEAVKAVLTGDVYVEERLSYCIESSIENSTESHMETCKETLSSDQQEKNDLVHLISAMTEREYQVFYRLAQGKAVRAVADELGVSAKTVSNYSAAIKAKLKASSNGELVHLAARAGVLSFASNTSN